MDTRVTSDAQDYVGRRILSAMDVATNYADAIFARLLGSIPADTGKLLDFGAGSGAFAGRLWAKGLKVDCVEPDLRYGDKLSRSGA
jgi:hypothetical protein